MSYTIRQKADYAIKWIDQLPGFKKSLKGGKLGNAEGGYCCIGAGCVLTKTKHKPSDISSEAFRIKVGLSFRTGAFCFDKNGVRRTFLGRWDLAGINDDTKATFMDISELLKSNPHWMFIPKVATLIEQHYSRTKN